MNIKDIKIGNRFRKDLGDIKTLAGSIKEIGLLQPVVINQNNELIAGQRRIEACKSLDWTEISVAVVNLDDIVKGEYHENAVRKGFTVSERVAILLEIEKKRLGHRQRKGNGSEKNSKLESFQKENKDKRSVDIVAKFTEVSQGQLAKEKKLVEMVTNNITNGNGLADKSREILDKVDKRKMGVDKACTVLQKLQRRNELVNSSSSSRPTFELPDNIQLIEGDFRNIDHIAMPDNSIHLIFVDTLYEEKWLPNYSDLAILAVRTLVQNGSLVTYCNQTQVPEIISIMKMHKLTYWHTIVVPLQNGFARNYPRRIVYKYKPLLWFIKGKRELGTDFLSDVVYSKKPDKNLSPYEQSPVEAEHVISRLTIEGQRVLDPMMGSGTTGIASLKLNRKFTGIDIDPETFKIAEANIKKYYSSKEKKR